MIAAPQASGAQTLAKRLQQALQNASQVGQELLPAPWQKLMPRTGSSFSQIVSKQLVIRFTFQGGGQPRTDGDTKRLRIVSRRMEGHLSVARCRGDTAGTPDIFAIFHHRCSCPASNAAMSLRNRRVSQQHPSRCSSCSGHLGIFPQVNTRDQKVHMRVWQERCGSGSGCSGVGAAAVQAPAAGWPCRPAVSGPCSSLVDVVMQGAAVGSGLGYCSAGWRINELWNMLCRCTFPPGLWVQVTVSATVCRVWTGMRAFKTGDMPEMMALEAGTHALDSQLSLAPRILILDAIV